jgi:hypothetical protein
MPTSSAPADIDGEAAALVLSLAVALFVDEVVGPAIPGGDGPDVPAPAGS